MEDIAGTADIAAASRKADKAAVAQAFLPVWAVVDKRAAAAEAAAAAAVAALERRQP